jgi:DNA-binding MarR family transcriptional regulator
MTLARRKMLTYATTPAVRDHCYCLHVRRAARALARRYDEALRPVGLTSGQFSLLMSLNRAEPARIAEVAALLAMDRTTLTANLKPLQRRRLLKVSVDPDDRRGRLLKLLPAGRRLLAAALPVWQRAQKAEERRLARASPARLRADLIALS